MGETMDAMDAGWEELRREARKLEGDLDVRLSSYAKLGGRLAHGDTGSSTDVIAGDRSWKSMEMEIQSLLEKLLDINDAMSRCAATATPTTSITQKLARHRDILHEFTQEFKRTKGNINAMREHAELLTSVRNDISEYKASGSMSPGPSLLRERAAIHGNISQVVNTSFAERCWSTYSFIHNVKRNNLNADRAKSLVYVHYNLRLLSHYCDADENAFCKRDMTWDNNPEETNLQDGTIVLERLQEELLSDHDGDHIPGGDMPPPSTTRVPDSSVLPLSTQHPLSRGGHSAAGRVPRSLPPVPPLIQRSREKKLEVSRGKRKS